MTEEETPVSNYAFIDGQNLHSGVTQLGWKLDHSKMRNYLKEEFSVNKAFIFIGFMEEQQDLYTALQDAGFILVFKPLVRYYDGTIKGNVDADMVLKVMVEINNYQQAVIISGDGDFHGLIRHLIQINKLRKLIIPNKENSSSLFERINEFDQRKYFIYMDNLKDKLTYGNVRQKQRRQTAKRPVGKSSKNRTKKTS
jgi:uncharacterized LabA/DUF88 family protein